MLACIGVYGVLAYAVAQRTREIGVRMALGAKPAEVTRMVLRRGMSLGGIGLLAGGGLATALGELLRTLLFGVTVMAPGIYAGTAAALVLVAMAACVIPAHRASRVDLSSPSATNNGTRIGFATPCPMWQVAGRHIFIA